MLQRDFEKTQDFLAELELVILGAGEKFEIVIDNIGVSTWFNFSLFGISSPALWLTGPGVALGVIYGAAHWALERRYLDSWEAYLNRESDRLKRIRQYIDRIDFENLNIHDPITQKSLENLKRQIEAYAADSHALYEILGEEYFQVLNAESEKEEQKKAESVWLARILGEDIYQKYLKLTNNIVLIPEPISKDVSIKFDSSQDLVDEKSRLEKIKNHVGFVLNSPVFSGILSYALAYWLVYYVAVEVYKLAVITPLSWGLLALTFPVIYLIYLEYSSYQKRLLEKDLDDIPEEKKEQEQNKRSSNLNYRYVWILVAAVFATALGGFLFSGTEFEIGQIIIIATFSFFVSLGLVKLVQDRIDRSVTAAQKNNQGPEMTPEKLVERKIQAQARRDQLDDIALNSYSLSLQSKLDAVQKERKNDNKRLTEAGFQPQPESIDAALVGGFSQKMPATAILRLVLSVLLLTLLGYALGALIGFVSQDFLRHFTTAYSGMVASIITGILSVVVAGFFGTRTYVNEKLHQNEIRQLSLQYQTQQATLNELNLKLEDLKEKLNHEEKKSQLDDLANPVKFAAFEHPVRNEGITSRKILYGIRATIQILAAIATASLLVRAVLKMGFGSLIPGLGNASLSLFGAAINPLAIVVISLMTFVFILKVVNDVYLTSQQNQEKNQFERSDYDIKVKEAEVNYLEQRLEWVSQLNSQTAVEQSSSVREGVLRVSLENLDEDESLFIKAAVGSASNSHHG